MEELNPLEIEIVNRISINYTSIKMHLPFLKVRGREKTGVGMYVNLAYTNGLEERLDIPDSAISSNDLIMIEGLKNGLNFEIDVSNGKLNFIEIVSNGEPWDGTFKDFLIIRI